jgi:long-chain acyl-CoA synthetase
MSLSLAAILQESAERRPDHPAVVLGGSSVSYRELWHGARQYAAVLRASGVGPGDRVALLIPNTTHFPLAYYGVLALGATAVPVHALLRAEEIAYVLEDSGAKALVCAGPLLGEGAKGADIAGVEVFTVLDGGESGARRLDAEAAAATPIDRYVMCEAEDVAVVLYTSGTTGKPKGAMLTHLNLLMNVEALALSAFDINGDDRVLGCLPLFHSFGQTVAMNLSFRVGATVVMLPRFDGVEAMRLLAEERCTLFMGVPTMYVALLAAAGRTALRPALRFAISGGASLPLKVLEDFEAEFGITVYEGYGLTETSPVATFNQRDWPPKPGTIGRAIWGVDVEIARPEVEKTIELLPTGELGELVVRGHNVMKGYLNRPDATAEVMVDGWFRTGDLGTKDADGFVTIVDRKKDMVLRGGYNVYPREVEEVLLRNPAIGQVAVIGVPDARLGEEVCAVIIPAEGAEADADAIVAWSREALAAYKYPRRVEFVDEFPLGPSGKILKRELVSRFGS